MSSETQGASKKITWIILNMFDKAQHNRAYLRTIYRFLPGKALKDWTDLYPAVKNRYWYIVDYLCQEKGIQSKNKDVNNYMDLVENGKLTSDELHYLMDYDAIDARWIAYCMAKLGWLKWTKQIVHEYWNKFEKDDLFRIINVMKVSD